MGERQTLTGIRKKIDTLKNVYDQVFVWGEVSEKQGAEYIYSLLTGEEKMSQGEMLHAGMSTIYSRVPSHIRHGMQERLFEEAPFKVTELRGHRVLERVGSGAINTVFFLGTEEDDRSWAVGINRRGFNNMEDALCYAARQEQDYRSIKKLFAAVSGLVPDEYRIIFNDHKNTPNVMFFREFIGGNLNDVFSLEKKELVDLLISNTQLAESALRFVAICMDNLPHIKRINLDLIGKRNLSIVTSECSSPRLVMVEPHSRDSTSHDDKGEEIEQRVIYLKDVVSEVTSQVS